jgi:hypothetical protein
LGQVERVVEVARGFVGVKESPPNSNNVIFNTDYYGKAVSGADYPWCCAFLWDVFRIAGLPNLFCDGAKTALCEYVLVFAEKHGRFVAKDKLRRGDLVLYQFPGSKRRTNHIGLVLGMDGGELLTIEGNTAAGNDSNGGAVMYRSRALESVVGGYRPNYEEDDDMTDERFDELMTAWMERQAKLPVAQNLAPDEYAEAIRLGLTDGSSPMGIPRRQSDAVMALRAYKKALGGAEVLN